jgi:hypothetical protein
MITSSKKKNSKLVSIPSPSPRSPPHLPDIITSPASIQDFRFRL